MDDNKKEGYERTEKRLKTFLNANRQNTIKKYNNE